MKSDKEYIRHCLLFSSKEKCCWCT